MKISERIFLTLMLAISVNIAFLSHALAYIDPSVTTYATQAIVGVVVAVGAVVMNRVRSGKFPNSIRGVIYQGGQFTPAGNGSVDRVATAGPRSSCLKAATAAMNGTDNTGGSLYFGRSVSGTPKAVIGNHKFY